MKNILKNKNICGIIVFTVMAAVFFLYTGRQGREDNRITVTIAVMEDDNVQNFNTNYYKQWLETRSGYKIRFEYISEGYESEYLYACLKSESGRIDAVFLPDKKKLLTSEEFQKLVKDDLIFNMSDYVTQESNFAAFLKEYDFALSQTEISGKDGIYFMPNMETTRKSRNMQVLWMNMDWLKTLGLKVPETVEEFQRILEAFRDNDPNGNGLSDELPLISCESAYELQSYNYLLNAYIYNDPLHMRMVVDETGSLKSAVKEEAFREGLKYCSALYKNGLLTDNCLFFSGRQLMELVNSPEDLVGAFTSQSIADIIYPNCADILAKFIQVPPLKGPNGEQNAVCLNLEPAIGGYIPANSSHAKEAFEIMDLMLSEEAALIASFGEEGEDWRFSENGDLSTYGSRARITTLHYLKDTVQNKHFAGAGPLVLALEYANGVTWNGNNSLVEYFDARAVKAYENYYYPEREIFYEEKWSALWSDMKKTQSDTDKKIFEFIFGKEDIFLDDVWEAYLYERIDYE